jgi:methyl-accepting chemotaxis protein
MNATLTAAAPVTPNQKLDSKTKASLFLLGFTILLNLLGVLTALSIKNSTKVSSNVIISIAFALLYGGCVVLVLNRQKTLAAGLVIAGQFIQSGILQNLTSAGNGYLWAATILVVGSATAVLLLPKQWVRWGILASNILGFLAEQIDFFGSKSRPFADVQVSGVSIGFVCFFLLVTVVIILWQWRWLDTGAKMLVAFLAAGGAVALLVQFTMVAVQNEFLKALVAVGSDAKAVLPVLQGNIQGIHSVSWLGLFLAGLVGLFIARGITDPLLVMVNALTNLAVGNLNRDLDQSIKNAIMARGDEIGTAGQGLVQAELYLQEMAGVAQKIADGDLTATIEPKSKKDELGTAFAKMVENLRSQVSQVADSASAVKDASDQLAMASNQAGQATNQIASTMQQIARNSAQQTEAMSRTASAADHMSRAIDSVAKGAGEQARAIGKAATITNEIASDIQKVASNAQASARQASEAAATAREGAKTVQATIQGMQSIKSKVGISAVKVQEMGERSGQIGEIVETIDDIASQTNLLALNAAIEAARAGEHGKGFAVVADEVRKLAERSSNATKEIGGLVKGIQKTVSEAVAAMNDGAKEVEQGVARANQSDGALASILKAAEAVNAQVMEIARAAQQISGSSDELVLSMDTVSAVVEENTAATEEMFAHSTEVTQAVASISNVSEENSAAVEEVSASTEEMSAQVQEVSASAHSLSNMATSLERVVAQFQY